MAEIATWNMINSKTGYGSSGSLSVVFLFKSNNYETHFSTENI